MSEKKKNPKVKIPTTIPEMIEPPTPTPTTKSKKLIKGSVEAKERMAYIRSLKGKKEKKVSE